MNKAELRGHLKKLRHDLTEAERHAFSQQICRRLEAMDWSGVRSLHCFEPIIKLGEVDITDFIVTLQTHYPHIQLYTSRRIDDIWKIVSLQGSSAAESLQFDAVIVPMLGFDSNLQRIGYGGGYYDKFLSMQQGARKVGVCFEGGKLQHVPVEAHDIPLNMIITESQTY